jgi:aminoacyl tRNA synthase complex-interacting multifunctional protein 1
MSIEIPKNHPASAVLQALAKAARAEAKESGEFNAELKGKPADAALDPIATSVSAAFGDAPAGSDPKEVHKWIKFALGDLNRVAQEVAASASGKSEKADGENPAQKTVRQQLFRLQKQLLVCSFLAGGSAESAADLAVFAVVHPLVALMNFKREDVLTFSGILRWTRHLERFSAGVAAVAEALDLKPLPDVSPESVPETYVFAAAKSKPAPKQQPKKQQQAKPKGESSAADQKKEARKEINRQKAAAKRGAGPKAAAAAGGPPSFANLDIRVGKITECDKHANADSMYVEKIDFGEASGPRQVVSGLVAFVPLEEMRNRTVVCVCNLKPSNLRGVKSAAMVLGAKKTDGDTVKLELLDAPEGAEPGDRVSLEGTPPAEGFPSQLNPKKKIWEKLQPSLATSASDPPVVTFEGKPLVVEGKGNIGAKSLQEATIG